MSILRAQPAAERMSLSTPMRRTLGAAALGVLDRRCLRNRVIEVRAPGAETSRQDPVGGCAEFALPTHYRVTTCAADCGPHRVRIIGRNRSTARLGDRYAMAFRRYRGTCVARHPASRWTALRRYWGHNNRWECVIDCSSATRFAVQVVAMSPFW